MSSKYTTVSDLFFTKPNYERNIVDIKNIYLDHLVSILSASMFDSIKLIYNKSKELVKGKNNISIEYAFKTCLSNIPTLSEDSLTKEIEKIKRQTNSSTYFDNLIKSVIKSHIVLMSYNVSKESCPVCNIEKYNINTNKFIHRCYICLANKIFNDPSIFINCLNDGKELNNIDHYVVGHKFDKLIKQSINSAIFDFIPVNDILCEYLGKERINSDQINAKKELEKDEFIDSITTAIQGAFENNNHTLMQILNDFENKIDNKLSQLSGGNEVKEEQIKLDSPVDIRPLVINQAIESTVGQTVKDINAVIANEIEIPQEPQSDDMVINDNNLKKLDEIKEKEREEEKDNEILDEMREVFKKSIGEVKEEVKEDAEVKDNKIEEDVKVEEDKVKEDVKDKSDVELQQLMLSDDDEIELPKEEPKDEHIEEEKPIEKVKEQPKRRGRPKKFVHNSSDKNDLDRFK